MKINETFLLDFNKIAKAQKNVFSESDLKIFFNQKLDQSFYRTYQKLNTLGLLKRFCRGIYVTPDFSLVDVNKKINESSYLSFEYVLAKHGLIGTYSDKILRVVICKGRTKRFSGLGSFLIQYKIQDDLFFGFNTIDGYETATPEKAYLDCLYFYIKGLRFSFDLFSDIDTQMLNHSLINKYLKKYKNSNFVSFVKEILKK